MVWGFEDLRVWAIDPAKDLSSTASTTYSIRTYFTAFCFFLFASVRPSSKYLALQNNFYETHSFTVGLLLTVLYSKY